MAHDFSSEVTFSDDTSEGCSIHYAYCHGFLSSENSFKGTFLRDVFDKSGVQLELLNLNGGPDASTLTYSGALDAVAAHHRRLQARSPGGRPVKLRLVGSSLGGYVAARYAELHPEQVDRLLLLCPGFDLAARWPALYGRAALARWEAEGGRDFVQQQDGRRVRVPFGFVADGRAQPAYPAYGCPAAIVHGLRDEVVPPEVSMEMFRRRGNLTSVYLVDDIHDLTSEAS
eukprot:CAMPEP_0206401390 /NCGR_PEP_ID=MMETSP0294-20121207/26235_1 /ASSEMBLY_ACC=CAM_ASM_000327 /TAXON_ID=39354 /ORGANISM="Heterosigma akashiwo, Strain CCMP2393" /LENGTH=228 /DNA_ID=CAMNT_0053858069 /DNA_START=115 /DNA_END=798 /DNA_ORIENTATION=-